MNTIPEVEEVAEQFRRMKAIPRPPWLIDRVQRRRKPKGVKLPHNTLCVDRSTQYGNFAAEVFSNKRKSSPVIMVRARNNKQAKELFAIWIRRPAQREIVEKFLRTCHEKHIEHLACWCGKDEECHADVWIEIWNKQGVG